MRGPLDGTTSFLLTTTFPKKSLAAIAESIYAILKRGILTSEFKIINLHIYLKNLCSRVRIILAIKLKIIILDNGI